MLRPRLLSPESFRDVKTKKFEGWWDQDQLRLSKSCRDWNFIENLANHCASLSFAIKNSTFSLLWSQVGKKGKEIRYCNHMTMSHPLEEGCGGKKLRFSSTSKLQIQHWHGQLHPYPLYGRKDHLGLEW